MTNILQVQGRQYEQLVGALSDAFPDANSLARMLQFRLAKKLTEVAVLPNLIQQIAFEVVGAANAQGWTAQLIVAARESQPANPKLLKICEDFGLTAATAQLERKVRDDLSYLNITEWRTRLGKVETQVCRVETPYDTGTGFLLGPDVVITAYHVMEKIIKRPARSSDVVIRFDYKCLADGTTINPGTSFRLKPSDWLLDDSPYSGIYLLADPGDQAPTMEELDYALLRLQDDPGNQSVAAQTAEPGAPNRQWIEIKKPVPILIADAPVFIVGHPEAWPLKLAMDTKSVLKTNQNGTRVRYRTNTEKGSSGSPVFNDQWELAALHHSGDRNIVPVFNQGIPFDAILALLHRRGKLNLLGV